MCKSNNINPISSDLFLYKDEKGEVKVEIYIFNERVWLTQEKLAQLFEVQRSAVTKYLKKIFGRVDDKKYHTKLYNLDVILSVGCRVNSIQNIHSRWANSVLKEYLIRGFSMNDKRLKNPQILFGKDYFEKQLARILAIQRRSCGVT